MGDVNCVIIIHHTPTSTSPLYLWHQRLLWIMLSAPLLYPWHLSLLWITDVAILFVSWHPCFLCGGINVSSESLTSTPPQYPWYQPLFCIPVINFPLCIPDINASSVFMISTPPLYIFLTSMHSHYSWNSLYQRLLCTHDINPSSLHILDINASSVFLNPFRVLRWVSKPPARDENKNGERPSGRLISG